ncbi:hypothetical protein GII36_04925 [Candidatus Mycosynbacter amalyticus]|uniref:Protein kinase domain-containing protein n=1 Tax=Candidatus Mycosynbacter amalyticus TaxID=2665156 RepID=A0A857MKN3_9BACT|nr:hypothetical protein [Candidatus Mycosynbacter amalyticus]QHN43164.1 hypothetical protein GII36_04925 [Candidatus Mycosynbacter amalyticus]
MNNTVATRVEPTRVVKTASTQDGVTRITRELQILSCLADTGCVANILSHQEGDGLASLVIERFDGTDLKSWIQLTDEWHATKIAWAQAKLRLELYMVLETKLLAHGVMYRDLNLEHVFFTDAGARMIDLEASLVRSDAGWMLDGAASNRGTWETMALEEFRRPVVLDLRTATYRTAIVAHLVLCGELPFVRKPRKHDTHMWRKFHAASVNQDLPKPVRRVFTAALSREPSHRYKSPANFFIALAAAYDSLS